MSLLTRAQHFALDVVIALVFALAPSVFAFEGLAAVLAYVLAAVHLVMSLLTKGMPLSRAGVFPFALHGLIEAAVGVVLGLVGWLVFEDVEQAFYLAMAALIVLIFAVTSYLDPAE